MCRHLGWLGEPRNLASLILVPPHGLLVQSYAPRRQNHGLVNADGWGAGFFADGKPRRWRSARPLWGDASFASVAPVLRSRCVVAAVRSASAGMPIDESAVAPFTDGTWLLSHNGIVDRGAVGEVSGAESVVDSAVLAARIFASGLENLGEVVRQVGAADPGARLNILAANGNELIATTWGDTLSILEAAHGVVVASEPYDDDPSWVDIPDRQVVRVRDGKVEVAPL
ncbi:ergothioneine biosynthesis protein EgtC [Mycobacteroides salmoniphilum]|uniref:ergothioneine biosynthesis protein EgtC n=1 Tax=Mycobacteroides salmoniphilum TaxID=404941 RepID=UPI0009948B23|nr:ergothioneine biosynthesis protein EgtC [Mycobacteroides salmoniphilum]QCH22086.1 Amidohydrolase EgtC [Mycobacteroides salmoniphilum]